MARLQQIIDTDTGEVLSSRNIKGNIDFVQIYRSHMPFTRELAMKEPKAFALFWYLVEQMDKENALIFGSARDVLRRCNARILAQSSSKSKGLTI